MIFSQQEFASVWRNIPDSKDKLDFLRQVATFVPRMGVPMILDIFSALYWPLDKFRALEYLEGHLVGISEDEVRAILKLMEPPYKETAIRLISRVANVPWDIMAMVMVQPQTTISFSIQYPPISFSAPSLFPLPASNTPSPPKTDFPPYEKLLAHLVDGEGCLVCMTYDSNWRLGCGHMLCGKCTKYLHQNKRSCPECREPITKADLCYLPKKE